MQSITRADILDWDAETVRGTAICYGLDVDDLTDDQVLTEFSDFLDDLEAMTHG